MVFYSNVDVQSPSRDRRIEELEADLEGILKTEEKLKSAESWVKEATV